MAKIDLSIPSLGNKFVDIRDALPGDAYSWSWERDLSQVNFLAIHHTGGSDTQTPQDIASLHIDKNGWGGIGYHFLIAKDGAVFYVGDISTARANVANLNEQVLGIGLVGDFTQGRVPTNEQLDSAHKLCEFFINYPPLSNVTSWDKLRGHKELPNQSTSCPGDDWSTFRIQIVEGISRDDSHSSENQVTQLKSQVNNLQTSLALVNQQLISLQQALREREQEVHTLKILLSQTKQEIYASKDELTPHIDNTLTIIGALVNLYKFAFPPRKEA